LARHLIDQIRVLVAEIEHDAIADTAFPPWISSSFRKLRSASFME